MIIYYTMFLVEYISSIYNLLTEIIKDLDMDDVKTLHAYGGCSDL